MLAYVQSHKLCGSLLCQQSRLLANKQYAQTPHPAIAAPLLPSAKSRRDYPLHNIWAYWGEASTQPCAPDAPLCIDWKRRCGQDAQKCECGRFITQQGSCAMAGAS